MQASRPKMLAVVTRFAWVQFDYLNALGRHFDLRVAWSGEGGKGAARDAVAEGMRCSPIGWIPEVGEAEVRSNLERVLSEWPADVVLLLYYHHDDLTLIVRELTGDDTVVAYQCWNSQAMLSEAEPGSEPWEREREALIASDIQVFVTDAMRAYMERMHGLDLGRSSLVVPQGFARHAIAPPSPKLTAEDGRVHMALVGTAADDPKSDRWFVDIIRRLVSQGLVVHSHFFEVPRFEMGDLRLDAYHELDAELDDYHFHDAVRHREGRLLSELMSRYDLMGVFHEVERAGRGGSANLAVCLPTKAVCGWLHGGIPVVTFPDFRGVVESIDALGIGFVIDRWEDLARVAADREAIATATERCLACRDRFTNEHNAERIRAFLDPWLSEMSAEAAERHPAGDLEAFPRDPDASARARQVWSAS